MANERADLSLSPLAKFLSPLAKERIAKEVKEAFLTQQAERWRAQAAVNECKGGNAFAAVPSSSSQTDLRDAPSPFQSKVCTTVPVPVPGQPPRTEPHRG